MAKKTTGKNARKASIKSLKKKVSKKAPKKSVNKKAGGKIAKAPSKKAANKSPIKRQAKKSSKKSPNKKTADRKLKKIAGKTIKKAAAKKTAKKASKPVINKEILACMEIVIYKLKNQYIINDIRTSDSNLISFQDDQAEYWILINNKDQVEYMISGIVDFPAFTNSDFVFIEEGDLAYFDEFMENRQEFIQEIREELGEMDEEEDDDNEEEVIIVVDMQDNNEPKD